VADYYAVAWSVGLCVCLSVVTFMSPAKTGQTDRDDIPEEDSDGTK